MSKARMRLFPTERPGFVLQGPPHKCALIFADNSGIDIILGVFPFVRELLFRGTEVSGEAVWVGLSPGLSALWAGAGEAGGPGLCWRIPIQGLGSICAPRDGPAALWKGVCWTGRQMWCHPDPRAGRARAHSEYCSAAGTSAPSQRPWSRVVTLGPCSSAAGLLALGQGEPG